MIGACHFNASLRRSRAPDQLHHAPFDATVYASSKCGRTRWRPPAPRAVQPPQAGRRWFDVARRCGSSRMPTKPSPLSRALDDPAAARRWDPARACARRATPTPRAADPRARRPQSPGPRWLSSRSAGTPRNPVLCDRERGALRSAPRGTRRKKPVGRDRRIHLRSGVTSSWSTRLD